MKTISYNVYQRSGRNWVCVGSFSERNDELNRRQGLVNFLFSNGIQITDKTLRKYSARVA